MKKYSRHLLGLATVIAVAVIVIVGGGFPAHAQASGSLDGWLWSSGAGWISASSSDAGAGGGPYGVTIDGSGNMTGYMWSSAIGWIKFGGLAGQTVGGMTTTDANVNTSNGHVTGWIRACAGMDDQVTPPPDQTTPNNTCTGPSRTDGWDGWIELSGANHPTGDPTGKGGVTFVTSSGGGYFTGYAWGATNVGWVSFNNLLLAGTANQNTFTVNGTSVSLATTPLATNYGTSTVTIAQSGTPQSINLSFGSFTGSSDLSISTSSSSLCAAASCNILVSIHLLNTTNPSPSYTIPINGTRASDSNVVTGSILVSVTGGGGITPTVSCSFTAGGLSTTTAPGTPIGVTANASETGYSGNYTYAWSDTTNDTNSASDPHTFTYSSPSGGFPYNPSVTVTDGNNITSPSASCGSVTVTGNTSSITTSVPKLWTTTTNPPPNTTFATTTLSPNTVIATPAVVNNKHVGMSINMIYAYPNDGSLTRCSGQTIGFVGSGSYSSTPSTWSGNFSQSSGSFNFPNLIQGVYTIQYQCVTSASKILHSNQVEIDVSSSTIQEQ